MRLEKVQDALNKKKITFEYNEEEAEFCVIVEEEAIVDAVFDLFKEQNADLFEFEEA